jgi:hypothetical protein
MASRHRSLTYTPPPEEMGEQVEPFTFTIREVDAGQDGAERINAERTFTAVEEIPGIVALDLGRAADEDTPETEKMSILYNIITTIVIDEDQRRFEKLLRTCEPVIKAPELMHYVQQILEEISGRPTEGQPDSAGSLPGTQTGSTDASGNGAGTPSEASPV